MHVRGAVRAHVHNHQKDPARSRNTPHTRLVRASDPAGSGDLRSRNRSRNRLEIPQVTPAERCAQVAQGATEEPRIRARTRRPVRLDRSEREELAFLGGDLDESRPATRGECVGGLRPCPFVGCRHNLFLDVNPKNGNLKFNFPAPSPWEMPPDESCALDIAEREGATLEEVGRMMNLTRERIRQVEAEGLEKLRVATDGRGDLLPDDDRRAE